MIYVDDMCMRATVGQLNGIWSHMFSDESITELDEFAERLGLHPRWIQNSRGFIHYDVTEAKRQEALRLGAKLISWRDLPDYARKIREQFAAASSTTQSDQSLSGRDSLLSVQATHTLRRRKK